MEKKYKAFISYRCSLEPDRTVADRLQRLLEKHHNGKRDVTWRIFRDISELPASSDLEKEIYDALDDSEYLIVICSKRFSESKWCQKEIDYFKAIHHNSTNNILPIVIEGNPQEVIPVQLTFSQHGIGGDRREKVVPLAANIVAESKKSMLKKLAIEYMRIVASLEGVTFDDVYDRRRRAGLHNRIVLGVTLLAISSILSISFAIYNAFMRGQMEGQLEQTKLENTKLLLAQSENYYREGDLLTAIEHAVKAFEVQDNHVPLVTNASNLLASEIGAFKKEDWLPSFRFRHDSEVSDYWFLDSGTRMVSQDLHGNIYLWDVETGRLIEDFSEYGISGRVLLNEQHLLAGNTGLRNSRKGVYSAKNSAQLGEISKGYKRFLMEEEIYIDDVWKFVIADGCDLYCINSRDGSFEKTQCNMAQPDDIDAWLTDEVKDILYDRMVYLICGGYILGYDFLNYISEGLFFYDEYGQSVKRKVYFSPIFNENSTFRMDDVKLITDDRIFVSVDGSEEPYVYVYRIENDVIQPNPIVLDLFADNDSVSENKNYYYFEYFLVDDYVLAIIYTDNLCYVCLVEDNNGTIGCKYRKSIVSSLTAQVGIVYGGLAANEKDLFYVISGNRILFVDTITGEIEKEYIFDEFISNFYYKECGFFTVMLRNGENIFISVNHYRDESDMMLLVESLGCKLSKYKYCAGTLAMVNENPHFVDVYKYIYNNDCEILCGEEVYPVKEILKSDKNNTLIVNGFKKVFWCNLDTGVTRVIVEADDYIQNVFIVDNTFWVETDDKEYRGFDIDNPDKEQSGFVQDLEAILADGIQTQEIVCEGGEWYYYDISNDGRKMLWQYGIWRDDEYCRLVRIADIDNIMKSVAFEMSSNTENIEYSFWNSDNSKVVLIYNNGEAALYNVNSGLMEEYFSEKKRNFISGLFVGDDIVFVCENNVLLKKNIEVGTENELDLKDYVNIAYVFYPKEVLLSTINDKYFLYKNNKNGIFIDGETMSVKYCIGDDVKQGEYPTFECYDYFNNRVICVEDNLIVAYPLYTDEELYFKAKTLF